MIGLIEEVRARKRLAAAKTIRVDAGVSQEQIARELKVNRVTIARWEDGKRTPRGEQLRAYVELLDQLREATAA